MPPPVVFDADVGFPHGLIKRAGSKQLRLCAGGFDPALIDNNDLIGIGDGRQPVGDDQQRLAPHQPCQCRLDDRLVFRVSVGSSLIENDDRCILQHGAGNGDALPLTAGQVTAGCTADRLIAVFKPHDELVAAAFFRCVDDFLVGRAFFTHADVVYNRKVKSEFQRAVAAFGSIALFGFNITVLAQVGNRPFYGRQRHG